MGWGMILSGALSLGMAMGGLGLSASFPTGTWRLVLVQIVLLLVGFGAINFWDVGAMTAGQTWLLAAALWLLILGLGAFALGQPRGIDLLGLAVASGAVVFGVGAFLRMGGWFAISAVVTGLIVTAPVFHLSARLVAMARGMAAFWLFAMDALFLAQLMAKVDAGDGPVAWMVLTALTGEGPGYGSSRPPALLDALLRGEVQVELYNLGLTVLFLAGWLLVFLRWSKARGDG